jgi:hypothetical protein
MGSPAHRSLPLHHFDHAPTTLGAEPLSQANRIGVFPIPGSLPWEERSRGRGGRRGGAGKGSQCPWRRRCAKTGGRSRPQGGGAYQSPRERKEPSASEGSRDRARSGVPT